MNRRGFMGPVGGGIGLVFVRRWPAADRFVERWSWAMGQPVHVMVFASSEQEGLDACAAVLAELRRVESRLTLFDTASDLCELNRRAGRTSLRADDDLRAVLAQAGAFKRLTGGAFDVAVEPLMRVWGFHRPRVSAPTAAELAEAREAVRAAVVELDGDVARLPSAHTQLDFGSIGVGYGIDRALAVLRGRAVRRALDRKSTRLNSSHGYISYAVFCLKKKKKEKSKKECRQTAETKQTTRTVTTRRTKPATRDTHQTAPDRFRQSCRLAITVITRSVRE